ncbi:MAG: deoxyribodipyrimidine photo-lyase [Alphaproteobacteria bacterium]|nr:MAG: deoxyribodipyrimidine photo-lyase [Alphaproteobacteria bacterium]
MTHPPLSGPSLVWLRCDLRLDDNPALDLAAKSGPMALLFILEEDPADPWPLGGASRWWLHHSLCSFESTLRSLDIKLFLRRGTPQQIVPDLAISMGARQVIWNNRHEPHAVARDKATKMALEAMGIAVHVPSSALLVDPQHVRTASGGPFRVFTPFAKACGSCDIPQPVPCPDAMVMAPACADIVSDRLEDWKLLPRTPDWAGGLRDSWQPGEAGALKAWKRFKTDALNDYAAARDIPAQNGTSCLSPHMHWGEISPRRLWHETQDMAHICASGVQKFLAELLWREFAHHLLAHNPLMPTEPLQPRFKHFPWRQDKEAFDRWTRGQTGIPIIDAGMRQLWQMGWMHNRVRMIVGSFLVKNLLLPWQDGQAWFWDTLVDADLANNAAGWQWIAGCGADAAPYFRVFNPVLQSTKFDPAGIYIRRFVPELAALPDDSIHAPWQAPPLRMAEFGIVLGRDYPFPMVDLAQSRARALAALSLVSVQTGKPPQSRL